MKSRCKRQIDQLCRVQIVSLDVDGVLTDGRKTYTVDGLFSLDFDARDGLGIHLLLLAGIRVALICNGNSEIVARRAKDLEVSVCSLGVQDKGLHVRRICRTYGIPPRQTAHVGDDLWDLSAFHVVGFRIAVADAHADVIAAANFETEAKGGHGAVREVADAILGAKGLNPVELLAQ